MRYKVIESTNNKAYIQCKGERMSIFMPKHEAVDMCIRLNAIVKFR